MMTRSDKLDRVRWLYHLTSADTVLGPVYAPASLATEGFVHCSFKDAVAESARLYFQAETVLVVLRIDPRRLAVPIDFASTPRGIMPHIHGPIPRHAIIEIFPLQRIQTAPDRIDDASPGS